MRHMAAGHTEAALAAMREIKAPSVWATMAKAAVKVRSDCARPALICQLATWVTTYLHRGYNAAVRALCLQRQRTSYKGKLLIHGFPHFVTFSPTTWFVAGTPAGRAAPLPGAHRQPHRGSCAARPRQHTNPRRHFLYIKQHQLWLVPPPSACGVDWHCSGAFGTAGGSCSCVP
jgi:hypothetical protein